MWRWGTPQNYCLVFIYELEKQLFNKKLLNWAAKKCKYLIFTKIKKIIKKIKGKHLEISLPYTCVPTIFMIWSTVVEISMWRTEIGNHGSFFALLPSPPKKLKISEFWKNEQNCWRYYHFTWVYQKPQSYEVQFLRYGVRQTKCFVILGHFFLPYNQENQNF